MLSYRYRVRKTHRITEVFPMEKYAAFKDLSRKAKVQYIWDYYRWHIVAASALWHLPFP